MQVVLFDDRVYSEDARSRLQHLAIHCRMYARMFLLLGRENLRFAHFRELKTFTVVLDGVRPSHNCENGGCKETWRTGTYTGERVFAEGAKEKEWIRDEWVKEVAKQLKGEAVFWKVANYTLPEIKVMVLA